MIDQLLTIELDRLGYIPGHIHAFWLIYKKMEAEERYGSGGFICESYSEMRGGANNVFRYWEWDVRAPLSEC
jgi:Proteolipid membrane potential modulator